MYFLSLRYEGRNDMSAAIENEWRREIAKIVAVWLLATLLAGLLLLTVVRGLFV